jgi:hypothetical protein
VITGAQIVVDLSHDVDVRRHGDEIFVFLIAVAVEMRITIVIEWLLPWGRCFWESKEEQKRPKVVRSRNTVSESGEATRS